MALSAHAVEMFRVSEYGGGHQIWFEAKAFDERNPDNDDFLPVVDKDDAFGQAITRKNAAGGTEGEWFFRERMRNSGNPSDWMLVAGDPDDDTSDVSACWTGATDSRRFLDVWVRRVPMIEAHHRILL